MAKNKGCSHAPIEDFARFYQKDGRLWVPYYSGGERLIHHMDFDTARKGVGYAIAILWEGTNIIPFSRAAQDAKRMILGGH